MRDMIEENMGLKFQCMNVLNAVDPDFVQMGYRVDDGCVMVYGKNYNARSFDDSYAFVDMDPGVYDVIGFAKGGIKYKGKYNITEENYEMVSPPTRGIIRDGEWYESDDEEVLPEG